MNTYKGGHAIIVSADEIKQTIPGYNPKASHLIHRESARIADRQFIFLLKKVAYKDVILMSGGSASGKTEYIDTFLRDEPYIIFDGTLPTVQGASIKIKRILKAKKSVSIHAIIPDDLRRAYAAFWGRDRKYEDLHFFRTHSSSRRTLLDVAMMYSELNMVLIESKYTSDTLQFEQFLFSDRKEMIDFLKIIQYTESQIRTLVV